MEASGSSITGRYKGLQLASSDLAQVVNLTTPSAAFRMVSRNSFGPDAEEITGPPELLQRSP
jgi:hypothetical protein